MIEIDINLIRESIIKNLKRLDNRPFNAYRKIDIKTNVITSAEGSAQVKIGDTEVLAGVKMDIGTPYSDSPDEGVLTCGAELLPLASPEFEFGPPGEEAIELARVVDRAIRESKAIDWKKLCIKENEAVWMVFVDIDVLNDDGNLIDAACIAAVSALATAKIPSYEIKNEKYVVDYTKEKEGRIPMSGIPISTTIVKIGNMILADPTIAEFKAIDARLTIGTIDKDGKIMLCSMQKGGPIGITQNELDKIIDLAVEKGKELRNLIPYELQ